LRAIKGVTGDEEGSTTILSKSTPAESRDVLLDG
jgi:hypothetical protein